MTRLAVIVAAAENDVIGRENELPWHLPEDLRYFRRITMGKPIVMGRKTYESIGRALPGRTNIVITRNPDFREEGVEVVASLDEALALARDSVLDAAVGELVVIGGSEIYSMAMPRASRLYLTRVHARVEGDARLPEIDWRLWREISRERHEAVSADSYAYSFIVYDRIVS
jgi:dihydrofolate reductase